jgi:ubiquitin conjugation factor E4 B
MADPPTASTTSPPPQVAEPEAKPRITITNLTTQPEVQVENPFMKLGVQPANGSGGPPIRIAPADSHAKRAREDSDPVTASPPPRKSTATPKEETLDAFESRILGNIFRITLEEGALDHSGHKLIFLPNLKQELEESGEPVRLSVGTLDSAILEAASKIPHNKSVLDYLLPCWKRTTRALKGIRGHASGRDTVLKEARRLCMSNIVFAITMPELYGLVICHRRGVLANNVAAGNQTQ